MNILPTFETFFHRHFLPPEIPKWGRFCTFFNLNEIPEKNWKLPIKLEMFDLTGTKFLVCATYWFKTRKLLEANGYVSVFNSQKWQIYESKHVYPRAFAVKTFYQAREINVDVPQIARSVAFTNDQELISQARAAGIKEATKLAYVAPETHDFVTINSYHHDTVSLNASVDQPSIIILSDNWHPNWRATIDGQPAHIGIVDETFRGIVVPSGNHTIIMHYRPKSLTMGQIVSATALLFLCFVLRFWKKIDKLLG
ncbi:MAG: YfhO family protein [Leptolyngbya sp.]|nr:YfhO family protein [Candidatus Melainabacteria bacterium]